MSDSIQVEELRYQISKLDKEIAFQKSLEYWTEGHTAQMERDRDRLYEQLCAVDGLSPEYED